MMNFHWKFTKINPGKSVLILKLVKLFFSKPVFSILHHRSQHIMNSDLQTQPSMPAFADVLTIQPYSKAPLQANGQLPPVKSLVTDSRSF